MRYFLTNLVGEGVGGIEGLLSLRSSDEDGYIGDCNKINTRHGNFMNLLLIAMLKVDAII